MLYFHNLKKLKSEKKLEKIKEHLGIGPTWIIQVNLSIVKIAD